MVKLSTLTSKDDDLLRALAASGDRIESNGVRTVKRALISPVIWAVSDVLNAYPQWMGATWLEVMDAIDLAQMFGQASANRRIAPPRSAMATLIFERMRQYFPDPARGQLKTGRPRHPADQPARMAA